MIENFMKAKAGLLMIALLMCAFTGFGSTTSDPAKNSEPVEVVQDATVIVVSAAPAIQEVVTQFASQDVFKIGTITSVDSDVLKLVSNEAKFLQVSEVKPPDIRNTHIGANTNRKDAKKAIVASIRQSSKNSPGGVLSLFYSPTILRE